MTKTEFVEELHKDSTELFKHLFVFERKYGPDCAKRVFQGLKDTLTELIKDCEAASAKYQAQAQGFGQGLSEKLKQ
jgi:hypothetical protein